MIHECGTHSRRLALLGRGINGREGESSTKDADSYRNSLNEKIYTLANVEIVACDALEAVAPDWLTPAMVAAHVLMTHILIDIVD